MTHPKPKAPVTELNVPEKHPDIPLSECVSHALDDYFKRLEGHSTTGLYSIMLAQVEKPLLEKTLHYAEGNQSRAAKLLGINRGTLRKKLALYDIS